MVRRADPTRPPPRHEVPLRPVPARRSACLDERVNRARSSLSLRSSVVRGLLAEHDLGGFDQDHDIVALREL